MVTNIPPALFVTGTDTDVGKSIVSAMLTLGLGASYWKPVQSGPGPNGTTGDRAYIQSLTGLAERHFLPERHRLSQPLSPHAAAAIDGIDISLSDFSLPDHDCPHLVVEGAGGLLVPLNPQDYMLDLMGQLQLPVVLVARSGLGTINHTLLSVAQLRHAGLSILGVVMNGPQNESNRAAIVHYAQVPILLELPVLTELSPGALQTAFDSITWPCTPMTASPERSTRGATWKQRSRTAAQTGWDGGIDAASIANVRATRSKSLTESLRKLDSESEKPGQINRNDLIQNGG